MSVKSLRQTVQGLLPSLTQPVRHSGHRAHEAGAARRLPVQPGQEACQVAAALALRPDDWLFPTYRDSVALVTRGIDPLEVLTLLRGDWHCG